MIAGTDLKRRIHQAMAREGVRSLSQLSRETGLRPGTLYGWFKAPHARVSPASVDKLVGALGSHPGDPWYEEPIERSLDAETLALLEAAVERAFERLGDRLIALLDQRLPRNGFQGG